MWPTQLLGLCDFVARHHQLLALQVRSRPLPIRSLQVLQVRSKVMSSYLSYVHSCVCSLCIQASGCVLLEAIYEFSGLFRAFMFGARGIQNFAMAQIQVSRAFFRVKPG